MNLIIFGLLTRPSECHTHTGLPFLLLLPLLSSFHFVPLALKTHQTRPSVYSFNVELNWLCWRLFIYFLCVIFFRGMLQNPTFKILTQPVRACLLRLPMDNERHWSVFIDCILFCGYRLIMISVTSREGKRNLPTNIPTKREETTFSWRNRKNWLYYMLNVRSFITKFSTIKLFMYDPFSVHCNTPGIPLSALSQGGFCLSSAQVLSLTWKAVRQSFTESACLGHGGFFFWFCNSSVCLSKFFSRYFLWCLLGSLITTCAEAVDLKAQSWK